MAQKDETRVGDGRAVISMQGRWVEWLGEHALTLWDEHGVDRRGGGYFESLASAPLRPDPAVGGLRRGRVVARQIYAFDVGHRLGWRSALSSPVDHGCDYLFSRLYDRDGVFHTAMDEGTQRPVAGFSLYEQAFYLFALARLAQSGRYPAEDTALRCLERLRAQFARKSGGFEESSPPRLPLKSNPHMHLLEAALEWIEAAAPTRREPWVSLARELVGLCLTHFRDVSSGAVREYFDFRWAPMPDETGKVIEPGHQFEWAWLMVRWARSTHSTPAERVECVHSARRMMDFAETWGVDPRRGVAVNEVWDDMTWKDDAAKLWPQTERVKAWCAVLNLAVSAADRSRACERVVTAAEGLDRYLRRDQPGLWHESMAADGTLCDGPCKASSFYHVVCAVEVMRETSSRLGGIA